MLFQQQVVRLVVVECPHDVIAIAPCLWTVDVELETAGIGIANQVQPVARPPLPVLRRVEQLVHQSFPGSGRLVDNERFELFGRWRHPQQVQVSSPDQCAPICRARWLQFAIRHGLAQKRINRIAIPRRIGDRWRSGTHRFPKRPELPLLFGDGALRELLFAAGCQWRGLYAGEFGTLLNPLP